MRGPLRRILGPPDVPQRAPSPTQPERSARAWHDAAAADLRAAYVSLPPAAPVRLGKSTSNLFRPRSRGTGPVLPTDRLGGVISVDPSSLTADVQGMCTYETIVEATLSHGLMPLVVPQLRTITLGGAVTGLGIESTSFRHGLPHESVLDMDILTGDGDLLTATADGPHADLFAAFPNSYGSLGYATRLRILLQPIGRRVTTRIHRFTDLDALTAAIAGVFDAANADAMDAVVFGPDESYLVLAAFTDEPGPASDYTGANIYYRSLQRRTEDALSASGYLWRWDTDWFWCSEAFGVQNPVIRSLWPRRLRRSDVYHRIVGLENRHHIAARVDRMRGLPPRERIVQDIEVPLENTAEFLRWYLREVDMTPVWLCPVKLREPHGPGSARSWPLYPLEPGRRYVNAGFWGSLPIAPGGADGDINRAIEAKVAALDGHKSLYSDVYYSREDFDRAYGGDTYREVKARYDSHHRLPDLYDKVVSS